MISAPGASEWLLMHRGHPYIGRTSVAEPSQCEEALRVLNRGRDNSRGDAVLATCNFEVPVGVRALVEAYHAATGSSGG